MQSVCPDPVTTLNILYGGELGTGKFRYFGEKAAFYTSDQEGNPIFPVMLIRGMMALRANRQGIRWELSVRCVKDAK